MFKGPHEVYRCLQVLGCLEFNLDANVLRLATHEQINLLLWKQIGVVANQCIEALLVVLDRVVEGQPCKLGETVVKNRWPKA